LQVEEGEAGSAQEKGEYDEEVEGDAGHQHVLCQQISTKKEEQGHRPDCGILIVYKEGRTNQNDLQKVDVDTDEAGEVDEGEVSEQPLKKTSMRATNALTLFHSIRLARSVQGFVQPRPEGERAKRASLLEDEHSRDEVRKMATDIMATSIHYCTNSIPLISFGSLGSFRSCFIKNAHNLASLGAGFA